MLSVPKQLVFFINILSVVEEMGTHYLSIYYTDIYLQNLIKQINLNQ